MSSHTSVASRGENSYLCLSLSAMLASMRHTVAFGVEHIFVVLFRLSLDLLSIPARLHLDPLCCSLDHVHVEDRLRLWLNRRSDMRGGGGGRRVAASLKGSCRWHYRRLLMRLSKRCHRVKRLSSRRDGRRPARRRRGQFRITSRRASNKVCHFHLGRLIIMSEHCRGQRQRGYGCRN